MLKRPQPRKADLTRENPSIFKASRCPSKTIWTAAAKKAIQGVEVTKILEDQDPPRKVYDPSHPDADKDGYVAMPNISVLKEMVDMMSATRSYEANVTVVKSAKRMIQKAMAI